MNRNCFLGQAIVLLLALSACGGGSGVTTAGGGLTPLDFDVVTDADSTVQADDVIGYAVEKNNPMYSAAEASVPAGYKLASLLLFEPQTDKGEGFSGDFTVRTQDRSVSATQGSSFGDVYRGVWDSRSQVWNSFRTGVYGHGTGGGFKFHLNYLGIVMLVAPTGSQFQVAAFADVATAPINTDVNFWVLSRNGEEPISYHWDFGDGTSADGAEVTHSYPLINGYNVTVTATDGAGNLAPVASTPIDIIANPVALTDVDVVVTDNGDGSFSYSATVNGGSSPFDYAWDLDGDGAVDSREGSHLVWSPRSNLYRGSLTVTDQTGAAAETEYITDARQITLQAVLDNADVGDPYSGFAPQLTHFSFTADGTTAQDTVTLDFGDGSSDTILGTLDHTYPDTGVYAAEAIVSRDVPGFGTVSKQSNTILLTIDPRPDPILESATPFRATVGSDVTITGHFFFSQEPGDTITMGPTEMAIKSWTPTEVVVTIPAGAKDAHPIVMHKWFPPRDSNPLQIDVAPTAPDQPGTGQL